MSAYADGKLEYHKSTTAITVITNEASYLYSQNKSSLNNLARAIQLLLLIALSENFRDLPIRKLVAVCIEKLRAKERSHVKDIVFFGLTECNKPV